MHCSVFCTLSYSTWFYICHSTIRARAPVMAFMPSFHPNSIKRTDFISRKLQPTWFWGAAKTSQCRLSLGWWDRAPGVLLIGQNILTGLLRLGWQKFAHKKPCRSSTYGSLCWVQSKDQSWKTKHMLSFISAMHSREVLLINSKTSCPDIFQIFTYSHIHSWEVLLIRPLSTPAAKATTWPWSRPTHTHTHTHLPACHALKMAIMLMIMVIDQGVSLQLATIEFWDRWCNIIVNILLVWICF